MERNFEQLYSGPRKHAPIEGNFGGNQVLDIRPGSWRTGYSSPPDLPGDWDEAITLNPEEPLGDFEYPLREVPWLSSVEPGLLHERGQRAFRRRYADAARQENRFR